MRHDERADERGDDEEQPEGLRLGGESHSGRAVSGRGTGRAPRVACGARKLRTLRPVSAPGIGRAAAVLYQGAT